MNEKPTSTPDSGSILPEKLDTKNHSWVESTDSSASSNSKFSPHVVLGILVASLSAGIAALIADPHLLQALLSGQALDRGLVAYGALVVFAGALSALHYYLPGPPK